MPYHIMSYHAIRRVISRDVYCQATKDGEQLLLLARKTVGKLQRETKEGTFRKDKLKQQQQQQRREGAPDPEVHFACEIELGGWVEL